MTTPAFITAMLLTRSPQRAEAAVLKAINRAGSCDQLLHRTVEVAVASSHDPNLSELSAAHTMLPAELRRVLTLPRPLAHCFVLRTLLAFSRQSCAQLLNLTPRQVDDFTCAALTALAQHPKEMAA